LRKRAAQARKHDGERNRAARSETPRDDAIESEGSKRGGQQKYSRPDRIAHHQGHAHPKAEQRAG